MSEPSLKLGDRISAETRAQMLDTVDRAYESRIAEGVEFQVDLLRTVNPELFCALDVEAYRTECERRLRALELGDWPNDEEAGR